MKGKAKVLLVGNIYNIHLNRLLKHLNNINPLIEVDFLNISGSKKEEIDADVVLKHLFHIRKFFPGWTYRIPLAGLVFSRVVDPIISWKKQINKTPYDVVNIHFITLESFFLFPYYKQSTRLILASPWGSDIYRKKGLNKYFTREVLAKSYRISAPKVKFREDIKHLYRIPEEKFITLGFGSDTIDLILNSQHVSRNEAKASLELEGHFVITCGYNGNRAQNHPDIIKAIYKILPDLPDDLTLLFPFTYGAPKGYKNELLTLLEDYKIPFRFIDNFLSDTELVYLRKCTDLFIHAQPTDAFSASIQEYLLADVTVINGKWTRYPELEQYGIPYIVFNSFEELPSRILEGINSSGERKITDDLRNFIKTKGWRHLAGAWNEFYISTASAK